MYPPVRSLLLIACALPFTLGALAAQAPLDPLETVKRINRNYNTINNHCQEADTGAARGHYYCSGVTLRMVNDGLFNPWDYSPYAVNSRGKTPWNLEPFRPRLSDSETRAAGCNPVPR